MKPTFALRRHLEDPLNDFRLFGNHLELLPVGTEFQPAGAQGSDLLSAGPSTLRFPRLRAPHRLDPAFFVRPAQDRQTDDQVREIPVIDPLFVIDPFVSQRHHHDPGIDDPEEHLQRIRNVGSGQPVQALHDQVGTGLDGPGLHPAQERLERPLVCILAPECRNPEVTVVLHQRNPVLLAPVFRQRGLTAQGVSVYLISSGKPQIRIGLMHELFMPLIDCVVKYKVGSSLGCQKQVGIPDRGRSAEKYHYFSALFVNETKTHTV